MRSIKHLYHDSRTQQLTLKNFGYYIIKLNLLVLRFIPFPRFIPFSVFYPFFRVLSLFPRFIPFSAFYPFFRVLSFFPRFILFSAFYPFFRVLSLFPRFILFSAFYPFFRVLSLFPRFIPFSAFYPFFHVLSLFPLPEFRNSVIPDPRFIPTRIGLLYKKITYQIKYSKISRVNKTLFDHIILNIFDCAQ